MRAIGSFVALTALVATASAEDAKPVPQVEAIRSMIGSWSGKGSVTSEGKAHAVTATYDCGETFGAGGVKCRFSMTGLPGFTYQFDDLWGYSAQDGLTHWYVVTNAGEVHDHRGHLDAAGGLLQIEIPTEGKVFSEVITFKRKNAKAMTISCLATHGGTLREKGELQLQLKGK
jgi:hypothetical protein